MNVNEIQDRFSKALEAFLNADAELLNYDASERAIAHSLATHLKEFFPDWDVDCEYNRIGDHGQRKLIQCSKEQFVESFAAGMIPDFVTSFEELQQSKYAVAVYPDIIVHQRGDPTANLLAIEMKKSNNTDVLLGWDQWKIRFYRANLSYKVGVFIVFNTRLNPAQHRELIQEIEWFT
jgi:hypothetical protein